MRPRRLLRGGVAGLLVAAAAVPLSATTATAIPPTWTVSQYAGTGTPGSTLEGVATSVQMFYPWGLDLDSQGNLYVADSSNRHIDKITPGGQLTFFAGDGSTASPVEGPAMSSPFQVPLGLTVDSHDNVYVADLGANRVVKITPGGALTYFAGNGSSGVPQAGVATQQPLWSVRGIDAGPNDDIYITSQGSNQVVKVTQAGQLSLVAGLPSGSTGPAAEGPATSSGMDTPMDVAVDSTGAVYISDYVHQRIEKVVDGTLSFVVGTGTCGNNAEGPATTVQICNAYGIAVLPGSDDLIINQYSKYRMLRLSGGNITYFAGTGTSGTRTYGSPATSQTLTTLYGVAAGCNAVYTGSPGLIEKIASTALSAPCTPSIASATPGDQKIDVTWTAPDNGGTPITGYTVTATPAQGSPVSTTVSGSMLTASVTGLTNGTSYDVTVKATNAIGDSPASRAVAATPATTPSKPTITQVSPADHQLDVTWTAPQSDGGSAVTGYTVTAAPAQGSPVSTSVNGSTVTASLTGLTNGTAYDVTVTATNGVGTTASDPVTGTPGAVPGQPTSVTATVAAGVGVVNVTWQAPQSTGGSPITGYTVSATPGLGSPVTVSEDGSTFETTLTGLVPGESYDITVTAANTNGPGTASTALPVTAIQPPGQAVVTGATPDDQSIGVTWTAPTATSADPVSGYTVTATPAQGQPVSTTVSSGTLSTTVTGLTNGTAYDVTVTATNAAGDGPAATAMTATPRTVPGQPAITAADPADQSIAVTWSAPSDTGGSPVTGYTVTATPAQGQPVSASVSGSTLSTTLTGLANGTAYDVTVTASTAAGAGQPSTAVPATPRTVPGQPAITAANPGDQTVAVTWSAPQSTGGSSITGYTVTATPAQGQPVSATVGGSTLSTTLTGLVPGTGYDVTVTAANAAGNGSPSTAASITAITVPGQPAITSATPGNSSVDVSWTAPVITSGTPVTGYRVTATPAQGQPVSATVGGSTMSTTLTGLTNGTAYDVTVTATNAAGDGTASTATAATPRTVPGQPAINAANAGDQTVAVTWTAPQSTGGSAITGYTVTATPAQGQPVSATVGGSTLSTTLTGLTNGTAYDVTVTAANAAGSGTASTAAPATPRTVPGQPAISSADPGDQSTTVSWSAPSDNGGSPVTGYLVTATPAQGQPVSATVGGSTLSTTLTGLTNGTAYDVTVTAANAAGSGTASTAATVTPRTVPGQPTILTAVPGDTGVAVTWSAPSDTGGSPVTGYTVTATPGQGQPVSATVGSSTLSTSLTGLTNGTQYSVTVTATNAAGDSTASAALLATPRTVPGAPAISSVTPDNGVVDVTWTAPQDDGGDAVSGYTIKVTPQGPGAPSPWTGTAGGNATTWQATGLDNGRAYQFEVSATNAAGDGPWSDQATTTPRTVPDAPAITAATPGDGTIDVTWTAPEDNGGNAVSGYTVRLTPLWLGGPQPSTTQTSAGVLTWQATGLENGKPYQVEVAASNAAGAGAWSDPETATPRTTPSAPAVTGAVPGDGTIDVSWTAPQDDGGDAVSGYTIRVTPQGGQAQTSSAPSNATTWQVTGLANGTPYTVEVAATNGAGTGAWSSPEGATPRTTPSAPAVILEPGDQQLTVTWTAPDDGGMPITGYQVTLTPQGIGAGSPTTVSRDASTTSWTATGLDNGRAYQVQVAAENVAGTGTWSEPATATPRDVPSTPAVTNRTPGDGSILVEWTPPAANGSPITGYTVRVTPSGGSPVDTTAAGDATSLLVTGLENGTPYQVQVRATNVAGDGDWSTPLSTTPRTVPDPVEATADPGDESFTIDWDAPANGGAPITAYVVRMTPAGGQVSTTEVGAQTTTWSPTGLDNGRMYTVLIAARNVAGTGAWSEPVVVTPRTVPGQVTGVQATAGDVSAQVSWTAPGDDGGSPITGYSITAVPDGNGPPVLATAGPDATSGTVTGLTNGITYTVSVAASNAAGTGAPSVGVPVVPVQPTAAVTAISGPSKVHVGVQDWTQPLSFHLTQPRMSVGLQLWSVGADRAVFSTTWTSSTPTTTFSGTVTLHAVSFPVWGTYQWRITPAAPSITGTADVVFKLHTLLGLTATRTGDRISVVGSLRAYNSVRGVYQVWPARPVLLQRWTSGGWTTLRTLTTDTGGNVFVNVRIPFRTGLRLTTADTAMFWGSTTLPQEL